MHAQPFSVSGKLTDSKDNSPLIGVNVTLTNIRDTLLVKGVSTDLEGSFIITDVDSGTYVLNISYISYKSIVKNISVTENLDLKLIPMAEESKLKVFNFMQTNGIKSLKSDYYTVTFVPESTTATLDKSKLFKEHPEIKETDYQKISQKKAYITVKLK